MSPLIAAARHDTAARRSVVAALEDQVRGICRPCVRHRTPTSALFAADAEYTVKTGGMPDPDDDGDPRVLAPVPLALEPLIEHGPRTGESRPYPAVRDVSGAVIDMLLPRNVDRPEENPDTTAELLLTVMFGVLSPELLLRAERPFRAAG